MPAAAPPVSPWRYDAAAHPYQAHQSVRSRQPIFPHPAPQNISPATTAQTHPAPLWIPPIAAPHSLPSRPWNNDDTTPPAAYLQTANQSLSRTLPLDG